MHVGIIPPTKKSLGMSWEDRICASAVGSALRAPLARTTPSAISAPRDIIRSLIAASTIGGNSPIRETALYDSTNVRISLNGFPVARPSRWFIGS